MSEEGAFKFNLPSLLMLLACWLGLVAFSRAWESVFFFATGEGRAAVQETMKTTGATSVSLALYDGEQFVWTEAFGFKDVVNERPIAASEDTLFGMGPVSKLFAAIAIMKLAEQGTLQLDKPVTNYLPTYRMQSPEFQAITIRMLLGHSSGIPGTDRRNLYTTVPFPDYPRQVIRTLRNQRLNCPPGYLHSYCNDAYTLVEELIGRVSLSSYSSFLQKEILDPLGMSHTRFPVLPFPEHICARSFRGRQRMPREFTNACAAAGIYSTPEDMSKLIAMLVNGGTVKGVRILSEASIQEMGRDQTRNGFNPVPSPMATFGLGWDTVNQPSLQAAGLRAWSIQGETPQFGTALIVVPAERMGVIVTGASGFTGTAAATVAERILLRKLVEKKTILEMPKPEEPSILPEAASPHDLLPLLFGVYASTEKAYKARPGRYYNSLRLDIFNPRTGVWQKMADNLKLRTDGWFVCDEEPSVGYLFEMADKRRYLAHRWVTRFCGVQEVFAEKVSPGTGIAPGWRALAGKTWLLINDLPTSLVRDEDGRIDLMTLPGENNLMFMRGNGFYPVDASKDGLRAEMILRIPGYAGRDLDDLVLLPRQGELCLQSGSRVYRPLEPIPPPPIP